MFDLSQTVALVTGAGSGIGRASALRLAAGRARVLVHYNTSREGAEWTLAELGSAGLGLLQADLCGWGEGRAAMQQALAEHPSLNLLVANAGVYEPMPFLEDEAAVVENWSRALQINLLSVMGMAHAFARHRRGQGGKIVMVSSRAGHRGEAGAAAYAASKAAMINLTKSLAVELAPERIYVTAVAPGWTDTPMSQAEPPEKQEAAAQGIPFGRMATADEIGAIVAFLASREADYLTGVTIDANGASYLR